MDEFTISSHGNKTALRVAMQEVSGNNDEVLILRGPIELPPATHLLLDTVEIRHNDPQAEVFVRRMTFGVQCMYPEWEDVKAFREDQWLPASELSRQVVATTQERDGNECLLQGQICLVFECITNRPGQVEAWVGGRLALDPSFSLEELSVMQRALWTYRSHREKEGKERLALAQEAAQDQTELFAYERKEATQKQANLGGIANAIVGGSPLPLMAGNPLRARAAEQRREARQQRRGRTSR